MLERLRGGYRGVRVGPWRKPLAQLVLLAETLRGHGEVPQGFASNPTPRLIAPRSSGIGRSMDGR
jgi:hypothetical protein